MLGYVGLVNLVDGILPALLFRIYLSGKRYGTPVYGT
jgi:hypothetical protein